MKYNAPFFFFFKKNFYCSFSNNSRVLCGVAGGIHTYIEKYRDFAIDYYFYLTLLNWEGLFIFYFYLYYFHFICI